MIEEFEKEELIELTDEQKRLVPQIKEFFEALKKQRYSLVTKEMPMYFDGGEDEIPDEVKDLFTDTNEELGDSDEYPKSIENIFKTVELFERGYTLNSLAEIHEIESDVNEELWEGIKEDILDTSFTIEEDDELELECPFDFNSSNRITDILFALDPDLYYYYRMYVQEDCGIVMYLKYVESYDGYEKEDGFESVSYNLKTKEMSVGSYIDVYQ